MTIPFLTLRPCPGIGYRIMSADSGLFQISLRDVGNSLTLVLPGSDKEKNNAKHDGRFSDCVGKYGRSKILALVGC